MNPMTLTQPNVLFRWWCRSPGGKLGKSLGKHPQGASEDRGMLGVGEGEVGRMSWI